MKWFLENIPGVGSTAFCFSSVFAFLCVMTVVPVNSVAEFLNDPGGDVFYCGLCALCWKGS